MITTYDVFEIIRNGDFIKYDYYEVDEQMTVADLEDMYPGYKAKYATQCTDFYNNGEPIIESSIDKEKWYEMFDEMVELASTSDVEDSNSLVDLYSVTYELEESQQIPNILLPNLQVWADDIMSYDEVEEEMNDLEDWDDITFDLEDIDDLPDDISPSKIEFNVILDENRNTLDIDLKYPDMGHYSLNIVEVEGKKHVFKVTITKI